MRKLGMTLSVAGLALLGACSRGNDARSDDALKNDLALAAQAQPYQAQQFVSPMEAQYGMPYGAQQYNAAARSPSYGPTPVYSPTCPYGWYLNAYGTCIPGPSTSPNLPVPGGPTAICMDGTYSYSQTRSGTCSYHGGVMTWLGP